MTRARTSPAATGALGGLAGGLVSGGAAAAVGMLPSVAALVRADLAVVGLAVYLVVAVVLGTGFGVLTAGLTGGAGNVLPWGLTYGAGWWLLGPLTLQPLLMRDPVAWHVEEARAELPMFFAHLLYGAVLALVVAGLRRPRHAARPTRGALARGAFAGLAAGVVLHAALASQRSSGMDGGMLAGGADTGSWVTVLTVGSLAGVAYAALYPDSEGGAGPAAIRGLVFGFLLWVVGPLTVAPLLAGQPPPWTPDEVRSDFPAVPGYLLFGATLATLSGGAHALARALLADSAPIREEEGPASRTVRALGHGTLAGLLGGLAFTVVMLTIGFLPTVARLVGSESATTGFVVHLAISVLIGASYGLLFRRRSFDAGSALGWGVSYGFLWWVLGALTLLPILLGGTPQWTAEAVDRTFASLVGHIAYGAVLGVTYYHLERRVRPWWVTRSEAERRRLAASRAELLGSAPALWSFVTLIALTMPVLVAR